MSLGIILDSGNLYCREVELALVETNRKAMLEVVEVKQNRREVFRIEGGEEFAQRVVFGTLLLFISEIRQIWIKILGNGQIFMNFCRTQSAYTAPPVQALSEHSSPILRPEGQVGEGGLSPVDQEHLSSSVWPHPSRSPTRTYSRQTTSWS
jgi:hypothetical protein